MTKIAIDAGHGSNTSGKRTPDCYREHWANVKVASYFAEAMKRCGIEYIKTGWNDDNYTDDADVALSTRQKQIKAAKCDYSISFHFNASGDGSTYNSAQGIETLISDKSAGDSLKMATVIQNELIKGTKQVNRGVKTQALSMCNCGAMGTKASVLIECGFMTNKYEADLMQTNAFCKECAEEAAKGFCAYIGKTYVSESTSSPAPTPEPASPSLALISQGLIYAKNFTTVDEKDVKKAKARVLQHAMNLDYGKSIEEDGSFGPKSKTKLGTHYVKKGNKQYMVTAAEILMYLNGINPNGVEYPGSYGNGLTTAAKSKFGGDGLKIDNNQFLQLL